MHLMLTVRKITIDLQEDFLFPSFVLFLQEELSQSILLFAMLLKSSKDLSVIYH